jgi:hypothetical protein
VVADLVAGLRLGADEVGVSGDVLADGEEGDAPCTGRRRRSTSFFITAVIASAPGTSG